MSETYGSGLLCVVDSLKPSVAAQNGDYKKSDSRVALAQARLHLRDIGEWKYGVSWNLNESDRSALVILDTA